MASIKNANSQMTLDCSEKNAEKSDSTSGKLVPICCMIVIIVANLNGSFLVPFFSIFAHNRSIPSRAFSLVESAGDGIYVFGYLFYLALVRLPTKQVVIFSTLTFTLTGFLFGFAGMIEDNTWFIAFCTFLRALSRISLVATKISIQSILLMLKSEENGSALAIIAVCEAAGVGIAQIYSGQAFHMWGFFAPFLITTIFNVSTFVCCIISFKKIRVRPESNGKAQMTTALKDSLVLVNLLGIISVGICTKFGTIFVSPFLAKQFDLNCCQLGYFFAFCYLFNSILQKISGRFIDRKINLDLLTTITLVSIVSGVICFNPPSFMGFERSVPISVACFISMQFGLVTKGMCHQMQMINRLVVLGFDQTKISVYILVSSIFFIFIAIGYMLAPFCLGFINDRYGFTGTCYFVIALMTVTHCIKLAHTVFQFVQSKNEKEDKSPIIK